MLPLDNDCCGGFLVRFQILYIRDPTALSTVFHSCVRVLRVRVLPIIFPYVSMTEIRWRCGFQKIWRRSRDKLNLVRSSICPQTNSRHCSPIALVLSTIQGTLSLSHWDEIWKQAEYLYINFVQPVLEKIQGANSLHFLKYYFLNYARQWSSIDADKIQKNKWWF